MTRQIPVLLLFIVVVFGCTAKRNTDKNLIVRGSESPAGVDSREPEMNATPDGRIVMSWVEKISPTRYALRLSIRDANGWSETRTVSEGDNWFINWADFPSVIALRDGSLAAHWLVKSGSSTYAYDVNVARSSDGGKTWAKPVVPHTDKTQTEHGFVSLLPLPDGRVGAVWLDGRNMKDMKDEDEHAPSPESMTLRYAAIDADGELSDEAQLDERVCECCQTAATLTSEGVIAVYRDRSDNEVRDIYTVRNWKGAWTSPYAIHADDWKINGCPVNGPSITADNRRVAVAWFTQAGDQARVKLAFSEDAGATFGQPVIVDDGQAVGRVDVLLLPDGSALVCWLAGTVEAGEIKVRRIAKDGAPGPISTIAKTDISRSSGFPKMARLGNIVHFAWTEFGRPSWVKTAEADVSAYQTASGE
jgi:hypothetical protein